MKEYALLVKLVFLRGYKVNMPVHYETELKYNLCSYLL